MSADWKKFCRGKDLEVEGDDIAVRLPGDRLHRVSVYEEGEVYRLVSVVVRAGIAKEVDNLALDVWMRNFGTELVGFKLDNRGRLVGETWIPKPGLGNQEFLTYVRSLAAECDRYEYQLTGSDVP
jgi:hypothetical protein